MSEGERITFDNNFLTINNQNLEEAEELEDRKRREEEIHNLLTHAMGDFNYDDQSTINTSIASDEDDNTNVPKRTSFTEKYREANADEQLKVLYEVRVREVMALNEQVDKLTSELAKQEQILKKKLTMAEIENEQKNMSLKEAQSLLMDKTEQINTLEKKLENTNLTVNNLEDQVTELKQEKFVLRQLNIDLEQQAAVMERGFLLHNKTSDKELQESLRIKISQLEISLNKATEQAEYKDRQHTELVNELTRGLQKKDEEIAEKNAFIDNLSENFESTRRQCDELQKTINELKGKTHRAGSPLGEELRKIRKYNERTDLLCENVRKAVSAEFHEQIVALNSENKILKETFEVQQRQVKQAQHYLKMIGDLKDEKDVLQNKLEEVEDKLDVLNIERDKLSHNLAQSEKDKESLTKKYGQLHVNNELLESTKKENEKLTKKIISLETYVDKLINHSTTERATQVALTSDNNTKLKQLQEELSIAQSNIDRLENTLQLAMQENSQLKFEINLEHEREGLIKKLQEKAAEFERIIFEKHKKRLKPKTVSVETNTEPSKEEKSLLKVKYDAILYQTETKLRKNLKKEFDEKLEKIVLEYNKKLGACKKCDILMMENRKLDDLREQDRQAIIKLADMWQQKFSDIERETELKIAKLTTSTTVQKQQLVSYTTQLEQRYKERRKKMNEQLGKLALEIEREKKLVIQSNIQRYGLLNNKLDEIKTKLGQGSDEIHAAESKFTKAKAALEKKKNK